MALVGLALLAATVFVVIRGTTEPTASGSIAIALSTAIAVPIGLAALAAAWRMGDSPRAHDLRTEAQAKARAAEALADAETAESIKREMEAYVALRARYLEWHRRRDELIQAAQAVEELHEELNKLERQLDLESSRLDPSTVHVLDDLLREQRPVGFSVAFPILGVDVGPFLAKLVAWVYEKVERARIKRLTHLAPDALSAVEKKDA